MESREYYRRNLPHIQPVGGTFFVTFNLHGSVPKALRDRITDEYEMQKIQVEKKPDAFLWLTALRKKYFKEQDDWLDKTSEGPHFVRNERIAALVAQTIHYWDGQKYELIAFCIMSNHVHIILRLFEKDSEGLLVNLDKVLHSIKRFSAREANKILGQQGAFWQHESFDYMVRNGTELKRIIQYVLNNPVKAGLCQNITDWRWSYILEMELY